MGETPSDTPLINFMKEKAKERKERAEKRAKKWKSHLEGIDESKSSKWTCAECGTTQRLEEDPDDRGTCYCEWCWDSWETAPKKKKKKKKGKDEVEEAEEEDDRSRKKKKKRDKEYDDNSKWRAKDAGDDWNEDDDY